MASLSTALYFDDILWHQSLNVAVFLDCCNHRFINDPEWGEILERVQVGTVSEGDISKMNSRVLEKVQLPSEVDCFETRLVYGCYSNKKWNLLSGAMYKNFLYSDWMYK
jgi:hypothetical protein